MYIRISVNNKIATLQDNVLIINGNSDYVIKFDFDSEWDAYETKTARFMTARGYTDVVFSGDEVALPVIQNERYIRIGVYAGDLRTTTSAVIFCRRCITDGSGSPADPAPDVYAQLMALLNDRIGIWYPTVDDAGNMSWEKSDTEEAPAPINIKGPIGETGTQGADGKSAYQYAVEGGYTGTETEFAKKLASGALIVTITESNGTLSADKSYIEIRDAYLAGIPVLVDYNGTALPLTTLTADALYFGTVQCDSGDATNPAVVATVIIEITSNNEVNDISAQVDIPSAVTDDHINSLIDTKLGVIENGSY